MPSAAALWEAEYEEAPVWDSLEDTIDAIAEIGTDSVEEKQMLDRIRITLRQIHRFKDAPTLLVSSQMLEGLNNTVINSIQDPIQRFVATDDISYLNAAHLGLHDVLNLVRGWPANAGQSLRSAAAAIRESIRASADNLAVVQDAIDGAKTNLEDKLAAFTQEATARENASIEQFHQLEQGLIAANGDMLRLDTRIDSAIDQMQARFTAAEQDRLTKHQEQLESEVEEFRNALAEAQERSDSALEAQEEAAQRVMERLRELQKDAEAVVGAVATSSTANWYKDNADSQGKSANTWRWIGVGLFIVTSCVIAWSVYISGGGEDSWKTTFLKGTTTATLAAGAAYAVSESRRHRTKEFESRKTELTLRALDPFIATLDEGDRQRLKIDTTRHIFIRDGKAETQNQYLDEANEEEVDG